MIGKLRNPTPPLSDEDSEYLVILYRLQVQQNAPRSRSKVKNQSILGDNNENSEKDVLKFFFTYSPRIFHIQDIVCVSTFIMSQTRSHDNVIHLVN